VPEGVVHALRKLHSALRPLGVLLDIHPEPQHSVVEIRTADQTIAVGQVDQTQDIGEIASARAALRQTLAEGLFVLERELPFDFVRHFESVETWLAYRTERKSRGTIADETLARSRALLAQTPGELCVRRGTRAARYRKA
jgi:hypothetical protein